MDPVAVPVVAPDAGTTAVVAAVVDAGRRRAPTASARPRESSDGSREEGPPGYVTMTTNRACDVFEDGHLLGRTPMMDRALAPGVHRLRFVPVDGSPERVQAVEVYSGVSSRVNLRWEIEEMQPTG